MKELYYSPLSKGSLGGIDRLYRAADKKYSRKDIVSWLRTQDVYTLHKPVVKKILRNRILVSHIDDVWQMDLVDMQAYKRENDSYGYMLTCIDIFSKYAWVKVLKKKQGKRS